MDAPQRVAGPVVAQRGELLRISHRGGQGHAPLLIAPRARQVEIWDRIPPGQDEQRLGRGNAQESPEQAEGVGAREGDPDQAQPPAAHRERLHADLGVAARQQRRHRRLREPGAPASLDEPHPAGVAHGAVEPVAALLARLARG
jgi:hypothetical protein